MMLDNSLISIVVPVYGVEDYITQCIDSLISQSYKNIEIILVIDGSIDKSDQICHQFATLDKRIKVITKNNGGLVSARKAGLKHATGKYLGFVDGDDWVGPNFVSELYESIASTSADLVIAGHVREFYGKLEVIAPRNSKGFYNREEVQEKLLPTAIYNGKFFQHGVSTYVWNKLFLRASLGSYINSVHDDIVMGEDAAITYPYLALAKSVVISDSASYFYRQRPNSIVKSVPDIKKEFQQLSYLFQHLKNNFEKHELSKLLLNQLQFYFYSQVLIRSGGFIGEQFSQSYLNPFQGLVENSKVLVLSSGSFGQHLVAAIQRIGKYKLAGWLDEDHIESQLSGLPVSAIEEILTIDFDTVIIASVNSEYCDIVTKKLELLGIDKNKISLLELNFDSLRIAIKRIGFDLDSYEFSEKLIF